MSRAGTVFPATLMVHPTASRAFWDYQLGLLRGDDHLVVTRPGGQGVSRCLGALSCYIHRVAGAQDRSVIRVYVRGGARCSEGLS